ncbi:hypothetical protein MNBD_GAMMA25-2532 [hydrothermal vent metagenome]|uniref:Uncharacterized protein n=1 Tax=hydrothermal vent metagenome TaxID=652676 RepID=A0A3B1AJ31_9ZZZZ
MRLVTRFELVAKNETELNGYLRNAFKRLNVYWCMDKLDA